MSNLRREITEKITDYARDFEVGNIDSAAAFRSWKRNLIKDILELVTGIGIQERQRVLEIIGGMKKDGENNRRWEEDLIDRGYNKALTDLRDKLELVDLGKG